MFDINYITKVDTKGLIKELAKLRFSIDRLSDSIQGKLEIPDSLIEELNEIKTQIENTI